MEVTKMARRNRTPEENERRAKIRELLQASNISSKTLSTSFGEVGVSVPRDRRGEFEPQV